MECQCPGTGRILELGCCVNCRIWVSLLGLTSLLGSWGQSLPGIISLIAGQVICCYRAVCSQGFRQICKSEWVWVSVASHSGSQGAPVNGFWLLMVIFFRVAPWASLFIGLWCLQVVVLLSTAWDSLFIKGSDSLSNGAGLAYWSGDFFGVVSATALTLSARAISGNFSHYFHLFLLCCRALCKPLSPNSLFELTLSGVDCFSRL